MDDSLNVSQKIRVEKGSVENISELGLIWSDLEGRADGHFFLSWSWIGTWLELVRQPVICLQAWHDQKIVGLALFCGRRGVRHKLFPVRSLHLNSSGIEADDVITIEYNRFLLDRGYEKSASAALIRYLLETPKIFEWAWNEIGLSGIDKEDAEAWVAASGLCHEVQSEVPSAFVDLDAIRDSGKPYLNHLSSNTRSQIRRSMRHYEQLYGPLKLTCAQTVAQALAYFDEAGVLHQKRWQERGKPGAFSFPFFVAFHRSLIEKCLDSGGVELLKIEAGAQVIGYIYNFLYRKRVYYYSSGFHYETDNRLKPGMISHALCIDRHLQLASSVYDFMAGDARYKFSLGTPGARMVNLNLQKPEISMRVLGMLKRIKNKLAPDQTH